MKASDLFVKCLEAEGVEFDARGRIDLARGPLDGGVITESVVPDVPIDPDGPTDQSAAILGARAGWR